MLRWKLWAVPATFVVVLVSTIPAHATIVRFDTVLGDVDVQLFDQTTPQTVANFLTYATAGDYICNIFHRRSTIESAGLQVLQGGGFEYQGQDALMSPAELARVEQRDPVVNEPGLTNVRGTIAMAKGADPNSATSQFFFNLTDEGQSFLDDQNQSHQGFTVFGEVISGMDVIDLFAALPTVDFREAANPDSFAFGETPVRDYTQADFDNDVTLDGGNLAIIKNVIIIDDTITPDSAADHLRIETPVVPQQVAAVSNPEPTTLSLLAVGGLLILRRRRIA